MQNFSLSIILQADPDFKLLVLVILSRDSQHHFIRFSYRFCHFISQLLVMELLVGLAEIALSISNNFMKEITTTDANSIYSTPQLFLEIDESTNQAKFQDYLPSINLIIEFG